MAGDAAMKGYELCPMRVATAPGSRADKGFRSRAVLGTPAVLAPGLPATPEEDLVYRGGKLIADLSFVNFYVGVGSWAQSDMDDIDAALEAAMTDPHLNNVMAQYFPGGRLTSRFAGSVPLDGPAPDVVSQGDVEVLVKRLFRAGKLARFDLTSTVFNFLLPPGTLLSTDEAPTTGLLAIQPRRAVESREHDEGEEGEGDSPIPHEEEDSTEGLGGFHGSVHVTANGTRVTLYYAVGVFSQRNPDGTQNGIVAFAKPWKNVVATFYHELNEARTDPDVEDAIKTNDQRFLGWTSERGEECGDFPVDEARPLSKVFKEITLASGTGTVPVQLQYSNAVHGPEGPIATPHAPLL
jgi:hypothetical protein